MEVIDLIFLSTAVFTAGLIIGVQIGRTLTNDKEIEENGDIEQDLSRAIRDEIRKYPK